MKFKVDRKSFTRFVNKILIKGYFTVNGSDEPNIREANIYASGGQEGMLTIIGSDVIGTVFCRASIQAEVLEEGVDFIGNLIEFVKILKMMHGDFVTIHFGEDSMDVSDGKMSYSDELGAREHLSDFDAWNDAAQFDAENETIFFEDAPGEEDPGYVYTRWFATSETKSLNGLHDISIKQICTDKIVIAQSDTSIKINVGTTTRAKAIEILLPVEWIEDAGIHEVKFILPILKSLEGLSTFYYYITSTGKKRYWIVDDSDLYDMEWMIRND